MLHHIDEKHQTFLNNHFVTQAGVPDLSDLFIWDMTTDSETRQQSTISEGDIIRAECADGVWRVGIVISWDEIFVTIDVDGREKLAWRDEENIELIAKLEDEDDDWTEEYEEWLDALQAS